MEPFESQFQVIWANLDPNGHMRHTAYNDYAAQVRVNLFADLGYSIDDWIVDGFGPVLLQENTTFHREVRINERITVNCAITGMRKSGKIWKFRHQVINQAGETACTIEITGAFLDLKLRKIASPPNRLLELMDRIPKTEDFEILE